MHPSWIYQLLILLFLPFVITATTTTAVVVETGRSAVFKHRVEVLVDGVESYSGSGVVEATRYNQDTLVLLTTKDVDNVASPLVSGPGSGRAVVVKSLGGRVSSLLHHTAEGGSSLNYKRALAAMLSPAHHDAELAYYTQTDVLGSCEVRYERKGSKTVTWRDLTRCSHFTSELVLGAHSLPLLHLSFDVLGSTSTCEYTWRGPPGGNLEEIECTETLFFGPRFTDASQVLNVTLRSHLFLTATATFNPEVYDYLEEATESTDLTFQVVPYETKDENVDVASLLKEACESEGKGRLTGSLLQKISQLVYALARAPAPLADFSYSCPITVRRMVAIGAALTGGPRTLRFFVSQLSELAKKPEDSFKLGDDFMFTLALRNLVNPDHHTRDKLPPGFFLSTENVVIYEELLDYLLAQSPPAVAEVAELLEGLRKVFPQLFETLLAKAGPHLSPEKACGSGDHAEAVRLLRAVSGLSARPLGYVASLRPCFTTDDVGVAVAAMDTLTSVDCNIQGVTELQKLGIESPSDPEIRIAAYRGLVHCLPEQPHLMETVAKALDPSHDAYSTQVASYVWSHIQSVVTSDDPRHEMLRELFLAASTIVESEDPVWYDPRQHSRHLSHTLHLDSHTALTIDGDLVWGRYSPAPRALYLNIVLHHDGDTHQVAQMVFRVTGVEAMLMSLPGVESLFNAGSRVLKDAWITLSHLVEKTVRSKREITQDQITDFIQQVLSRIPAEYRAGMSSVEFSLRLLGTHALHTRLSDLHKKSFQHSLSQIILSQMQTAISDLAPLLDNTLTLATASGVPVSLGVSGTGGLQAMYMHYAGAGGGLLETSVSGGLAITSRLAVGHDRPPVLRSEYLWSLDLPLSASHEGKDSSVKVSFRLPQDWSGRVWQHHRDTSIGNKFVQQSSTQECHGSEGAIQLCIESRNDDELEGTLNTVPKNRWLAPFGTAWDLQLANPGDPVVVTITNPQVPGTNMRLIEIEAGAVTFDASVVFQMVPSPSFVLSFKSPQHSYFVKGFAGSRESITQMVSLEMGRDQSRYGLRLQMSTPQLEEQRVWSPSVSLITPEGGDEELLRAFLSLKDEVNGFSSEFSLTTSGVAEEYLNLKVSGDVAGQENGKVMQMLEVRSLKITWPEKVDLEFKGKIYLTQRPQGEGTIKVGWGQDESQVEFHLSLAPVVTFDPPPEVNGPRGSGGTSLKLGVKVAQKTAPEIAEASLDLLLDKTRVDVKLNLALAGTGVFNFSHTYNGPLDFKTVAMVSYAPLQISWGAEHELLLMSNELRHSLNVTWSQRPDDQFSSVLHFVNNAPPGGLDVALYLLLAYPGQVIEVDEALLLERGGIYKNKMRLHLDPGRTMMMDTVIISRNEPGLTSYGLSNSFRMDTWLSSINVVGTFNCVGGTKCSVVMSAEQAGDQLAEIRIENTAARAVSRTEAEVMVTHFVNGTLSLDSVFDVGYHDIKWHFTVVPWLRVIQGRAEVSLSSNDVAAAEMIVARVGGATRGEVTHLYNGTFSLNPTTRSIHTRQEVRLVERGANELWAAVLQGRAGEQVLNSRHFGKATLMMPSGMFYTANGDVSSEVRGWDSVVAGVSLSAGAGVAASHVLTWTLNLQQEDPSTRHSLSTADSEEVIEGAPLLTLESLLRANTPSTGEVKLNVKSKKLRQSTPTDSESVEEGEKIDVDVRLITETVPELGRIHGSLSRSSSTYSLNGRVWSGAKSLGVVSYGIANNETTKSSHTLTIVDPALPWSRMEVLVETDHLGALPFNFQTSVGSKLTLGMEEAGTVGAIVQWTPGVSSISLGFGTYLEELPGGNVFFKWATSSVETQMVWADLKTLAGVRWAAGGRGLEFIANYENPNSWLHHLDGSVTFLLSQPPHPPVSVSLVGRVSVNKAQHYILNVNCQSEREQYLVTAALVRPIGSASVRLQFRREGKAYKAVGTLLLDSLQAQVEGSFTQLSTGEDLSLTLTTSLLPDPAGYTLRFYRKNEAEASEFAFLFSQAGEDPDWVYSYRVFAKLERDIKSRLRRMLLEDQFTQHQRLTVVKNYNFFILVIHNKFDETDLELEFPDLWAQLKVTGTVVKGKDSHVHLVVATPSIKHIIECRLIFSSEAWHSAHSGSLTYTQQGKKGRGEPLKLELEALKWNSNRQRYTFSFQKMFTESSSTNVEYDYPHEPYDLNGYSYDDPGQQVGFSTFESSLEVSHDPGSSEYKMAWQTDDTTNEANLLLESDHSGGSGRLKYHQRLKGRPKAEVEYLVKGNFRRFDTELTFSCTLDQSSIGRARAINFLHSEAEGYTELVLDMFEDEADQVILVITYLPDSFRVRIGQFGNTFLQIGYKKEIKDEGGLMRSFQFESSGRSMEVWAGSVPEDQRVCAKGGMMIQTPTLAPTYYAVSMCSAPVPELTVQVMGVEEHEGPYLRVGQISGPGGVGVQLGSGRLQPLDTPPALTLTADVEKEVLEVLLDWQSPSLTQLEEEFLSRRHSVWLALDGLGATGVHVQGALRFGRLWEDTEGLLTQALQLCGRESSHVMFGLLDKIPEIDIDDLLRVSTRSIRQNVWEVVLHSMEYLEQLWEDSGDFVEEGFDVVEEVVERIVGEVEGWLDDMKSVLNDATYIINWALHEKIRPPLLRIQAAVDSLTYNDDQTLYALVSRIMADVKTKAGRHEGAKGFALTQVFTRLERALVTSSRWEELRSRGAELLVQLQKLTIVSFSMPHATAVKCRVATPSRLGSDLQVVGRWFLDEGGPRLLDDMKMWLSTHWSRLRYLLTWHVYGEAITLGWENAITWDGRHVSPLLTDSCHHLLVLLTQAATPTAITLHMEDLEAAPRRVFTFFSGKDRVTLDSSLKMTYNSRNIRSPHLNLGALTLTWALGRAKVASSEGLSLECYLTEDLCRLSVTSDHFAATVGLLGVFDFDNNTDFMTSDWEIPASVDEWAESWRVSSTEQCSSALPESLTPSSDDKYCSDLFKSNSSPLSSCFESVPSSPYLESCLVGKACAAETAYVHSCDRHYHGLSQNISSYCQSCSLHGEEERGTDDLRKEVVIITDFECLEDLQDLVTALLKDSKKDRRVLIRYIGRGTPPVEALDGISEMVLDSGTPPLEAVATAAAVDFSPRALKSIILFDCEHPRCTVSSTSAAVQQLRSTLLTQGIQLHVVTNDAITIMNPDALSNKARKQLLGMDVRTSYMISHARKRVVKGHRGNREFITSPIGNTCGSLAVETDGSVFSLQQLKLHRKYHRKIFQQLLALRLETGWEAEYLRCRRCECGLPCSLCHPPSPHVYTKSGKDEREEDEDEDYEDDEEEEEPKNKGKRKNKKSQKRGRG